MSDNLLDTIRRYADANADAQGIARTCIPGLFAVRATTPTALAYDISRPLVALVVQGSKRVTTGSDTFDFGAGESMLIAADVPTISQITRADRGKPYYSFVLELDSAVIEALTREIDVVEADRGNGPVRIDPTEAEVADAALRLMRLLDRPASIPLLQSHLLRELHYWLLVGRHGAAIRGLGVAESHARRIARAVAIIRAEFARPLRVERLAEASGMSPTSFHQHFRAATSLSPLQFQKQLRLIEARRLMLSEGTSPSNVAHTVGYESVPQFTREYGRFFGAPPVRDIKNAKSRLQIAA
ncbi:AraC family transcriptional regulator [Bradyrhizobium sp. LVM 105]|uniref:AraC family transcriptional regulator n=1 Tax=Bradyrhizobium sp. LVM 105 TaxID=2341115 RepID=UPI000F7FF819|nr:AraC family transcriptional regulator [Bradyrhizobium sp. LVM 105]RTE91337.1 AraC family transcriptional regulator [Bradyrhizobium sp. LVM 105]